MPVGCLNVNLRRADALRVDIRRRLNLLLSRAAYLDGRKAEALPTHASRVNAPTLWRACLNLGSADAGMADAGGGNPVPVRWLGFNVRSADDSRSNAGGNGYFKPVGAPDLHGGGADAGAVGAYRRQGMPRRDAALNLGSAEASRPQTPPPLLLPG